MKATEAKRKLCEIRNNLTDDAQKACLYSIINREEVQKLKTDDPATFCELLAFYEETKRHDDEVKKIATRLGMSD